jgi:hypothetical protein
MLGASYVTLKHIYQHYYNQHKKQLIIPNVSASGEDSRACRQIIKLLVSNHSTMLGSQSFAYQ